MVLKQSDVNAINTDTVHKALNYFSILRLKPLYACHNAFVLGAYHLFTGVCLIHFVM